MKSPMKLNLLENISVGGRILFAGLLLALPLAGCASAAESEGQQEAAATAEPASSGSAKSGTPNGDVNDGTQAQPSHAVGSDDGTNTNGEPNPSPWLTGGTGPIEPNPSPWTNAPHHSAPIALTKDVPR